MQLCLNLIAKLFDKENSLCKQKYPEVKIKRQVLDHYIPGLSNITSHYGLITNAVLPPQSTNHPPHRIQTDDTELDFSKVFTKYITNIEHPSSQRSKSILTNIVFFINYSYVSIFEANGTFYVSSPQTSRQYQDLKEIFSHNFKCDPLTDSEISQIIQIDLQKILTWFIIQYFQHNSNLILLARKIFRPKTEDETILADRTDYVWTQTGLTYCFLISLIVSKYSNR